MSGQMITRKADGNCIECGHGLGGHLKQCRFAEAPGDSVNVPPHLDPMKVAANVCVFGSCDAPANAMSAFRYCDMHSNETRPPLPKDDPVKHPKHYTVGKHEVWDVIIDWGLNYCRGNVVKYIARAGLKNPRTEVQDLEKARAYLEKEIERVKAQQPKDWK